MDYNSDSELIESLDYLTLPVKRSSSTGVESNLHEKQNKTRYLRDFRNTISHKTQTSHFHRCNDSLIVNSTKKKIIEYYAFVSSSDTPSSNGLQPAATPNKIKEPSIIKVTVTPKKTKPHKSNTLTRRKQNPKHIHSTASGEDRSVQTKRMYLVFSGKTKERHINIKTTESAKLLNDINKLNDDISLERVKNVQKVINSLDMDKKRKKVNNKIGSQSKGAKSSPKGEKDKTEKNIQTNACQSVVRITGQIGLGDDNQILLRCGVEGPKVPKNDMPTNDMKRSRNPYIVQASASALLHTVTQGTQIDNDLVEAPFFTNNITCFRNNVTDNNQFNNEFNDYDQAQRCPSPLVVITVYPNDERCESIKIFKQKRSPIMNMNENYTNVNYMPQYNQPNQNYPDEQYGKYKTKSKTNVNNRRTRPASKDRGKNKGIKDGGNSSRSRSPSRSTYSSSSQYIKRQSPVRKNSPTSPRSPKNWSPSENSNNISKRPGTENKDLKTHQSRNARAQPAISRNTSPDKSSAKNNYILRNQKRSSSPQSRSPSAQSNRNTKREEVDVTRRPKPSDRSKPIDGTQRNFGKGNKTNTSHAQNMTSTSTNTEHALTKKALVDTFTNEIMGQMKNSKGYNNPHLTESQVTVSIQGENQNYDVILQQGRTTNVKVKKTLKGPSGRINYEGNENIDYIDIKVDKKQNESHSKKENFAAPDIKVRDSLEIGHKRKDRSPRATTEREEEINFYNLLSQGTREAESFAPVKHYRGDSCVVPDPVKRDREVRNLLGLETVTRNECCDCEPISCPRKYHQPCQLFHANDNAESRLKKEIRKNEVQISEIKTPTRFIKHTIGTQYETPNFNWNINKHTMLNQNLQVFLELSKQKPIVLSRKQYHKIKRSMDRTISKSKYPKDKQMKTKGGMGDFLKKEDTSKLFVGSHREQPRDVTAGTKSKPNIFVNDVSVLFSKEYRRTESVKQETFLSSDWMCGSTKVAVGSSRSHSIHTIFRGLKKQHTPNFGTSSCSFFSENTNPSHDTKSVKNVKPPPDSPRKQKPFFKRLMSCLVLRQSSVSELKFDAAPQRKKNYNSSVDSYHISTSLGALEMSSSIYDTSESFYSNHSIIPINSKIHKRSFFGSVRGLLTYGKH